MKRMKVLGLCLIAAFALSVAVAASAQAAKVASGPIHVESEGGKAELGNSVAFIECKSHTAKSDIVGPIEANKVVFNYVGCEVAGKGIPCGNVGPGEIETLSLVSKLGWARAEGKQRGEVAVDFKPESGELLAKFVCKKYSEVLVYGAMLGLTAPKNVMVTTGTVKFTEIGFKNQPEEFETGGPPFLELPEFLEAEFIFVEKCRRVPGDVGKYTDSECTKPGTGEFEKVKEPTKKVAAGLTQSDNTKNHGAFCKVKNGKEKCKPNAAEVNTFATGQPQYGRCKKKKGGKFTDTSCASLTPPGGKGKYEFVPIPG